MLKDTNQIEESEKSEKQVMVILSKWEGTKLSSKTKGWWGKI